VVTLSLSAGGQSRWLRRVAGVAFIVMGAQFLLRKA